MIWVEKVLIGACALSAGILSYGAAAHAQTASPERVLRYAILMEKNQIGDETYRISTQGDHTKIDVTTDSKAAILFFKYDYHHTHTEVWNGGKLESYVSDTNDNGTLHRIEAYRSGNAILAKVDDKPEVTLPDNASPFSIWNKGDMARNSVFSIIDLDPMNIKAGDLGQQPVQMGDAKVNAEKFHMTGDEVRDLWYAPDNTLLKTEFKEFGYHIAFVKE